MINIKLMIFVAILLSIPWATKGQLMLPAPENVSACVTYQGNRTLLNVRWQDEALSTSSEAQHIIYYSSSNSNFSDSTIQPLVNSANNITGIVIPNNLDGEQLQIRVVLRVLETDSDVSMTTVLGVSPIYLASYEAVNITGIRTILRLGFQLACGLEDVVMCVVNIRNINASFPVSSITHEITNNTDNRSNSFDPPKVFLNFPNIMMGTDYFVHARLLNSERTLIGPEHQRIINVGAPRSVNTMPIPPSTSSSEIVTTSTVASTTTLTGFTTTITVTPIDLTTSTTAAMTDQIEITPTSSSGGIATDSDGSSSIGIAIGVTIGCFILLALSITLCTVIVIMKRNEKQKKKRPSPNSDDNSVPDESFVYANRFSCSSTSMLQSSTTDLIQACNGRHASKNQKHDYSLPPDANYILYEETPQVQIPPNNAIPSHYETAENQTTQMKPFLLNGHYEMSNTVMFDAAVLENSMTVTDYSELVHNSHHNGNDIPPTPMGGYDYDQLDQSLSNQDTVGPHYYDPVANNVSQQQQQIKQSDGYTELQNSTTNHDQNKPYQVLTNSNIHPRHVVHQYEDVDNDNGNYSEPYKGKKLPRHDYDLVAGDAIPLPKRPFVREYSEPRDTLNIFID